MLQTNFFNLLRSNFVPPHTPYRSQTTTVLIKLTLLPVCVRVLEPVLLQFLPKHFGFHLNLLCFQNAQLLFSSFFSFFSTTVPSLATQLSRSSAQTPLPSNAYQTTACASHSFLSTFDQHVPIQPSLQPTTITSLTRSTFGARKLLQSSNISIYLPIRVSVLPHGKFLFLLLCCVLCFDLRLHNFKKISHELFVKRLQLFTCVGAEVSSTHFITPVGKSAQLNFHLILTFCPLKWSQRQPDPCKKQHRNVPIPFPDSENSGF